MASALNHLARAPSKAALEGVVDACFRTRADPSQLHVAPIAAEFGLSVGEGLAMATALREVIAKSLYVSHDTDAVGAVAAAVPDGADARLVKLLGQIIGVRLPAWREVCALQRVSLPKFVSMDWRVGIVAASDRAGAIAQPSTVVSLQVEDQPHSVRDMPEVRRVTFELSREALQTMLDDLSKIRDELQSIQ